MTSGLIVIHPYCKMTKLLHNFARIKPKNPKKKNHKKKNSPRNLKPIPTKNFRIWYYLFIFDKFSFGDFLSCTE